MNDRQRIKQATGRAFSARSELYRDDGTRIYADQEHTAREREIERELEAAMTRIEESISSRLETAKADLQSAEHADPAPTLNTDELQRAAALAAFVGEEMRDLSLPALAHRVRVVANSGDKAEMYALLRSASLRADEDPSGTLREALRGLASAIDPTAEARLEQAKADLEEAEDLQFEAQMARAGASNLGDVFFGNGGAPSSYWPEGA
jgi:hypothetical protein